MPITQPTVLPPWADVGDKVQPTNGEIETGWPLTAIRPARQRWNWVLNYCMNGVRYLMRRGLPDYAATETYIVGDLVRGTDNLTYISLQAANLNNTPQSAAAFWNLAYRRYDYVPTVGGTANAITLTPAPAITAHTVGQRFSFLVATTNTGAVTIAVSGLTAGALTKNGAVALAANDLTAGELITVTVAALAPTRFYLGAIQTSTTIPSGSVLLFWQAAAPVGWTKLTTQDDKTLRVVSGVGGGSAGASAFTTVFGAGRTTAAHTLAIASMPAHTHDITTGIGNLGGGVIRTFDAQNSSQSSAPTGGGGSHSHNLTMDLQYINVILCSKN